MLNLLKSILSKSYENSKKLNENKSADTSEYEHNKVSHILADNKIAIKNIFDNFSDLIIREVKITNDPEFGAMLAYLNNMIETGLIEEYIIEKLTNKREEYTYCPGSKEYSKYLFGIRDEDIYMDIEANYKFKS